MRIFKYNEELTLDITKIQKKYRKQINLTLIILFLFSQNLYAKDSKFSVGLSFSSTNISDSPFISDGNGGKLDLDYKINSLFTLQLSYLDLDSTHATRSFYPTTNPLNLSQAQTSLNIDGYGLSLLANHKWNKVFVYGKLGVLSSVLKFNSVAIIGNETLVSNIPRDTANKIYYGFGTGYKLSSKFDLVLDYSRSQIGSFSENWDIGTTSLGIKYNF